MIYLPVLLLLCVPTRVAVLVLHQIELPNNIPDFSPSATIEHHLNRLALSEKARTMQEIYEKIKSKDLTPGPRVICHLDLFQSNILISPKGELQLIDWEYSAPALQSIMHV